MRRFLLNLVCIGTAFNCLAQQTDKQFIVTTAFQHARVDYTIGEIVVGQYSNTANRISYALPFHEIVLGTEPNTLGDISIYPNPATLEVVIESMTKISGYKVMDITGKYLLERNSAFSPATELSIPTGNLPEGVYMLHLMFSNGSASKIKFIKAE